MINGEINYPGLVLESLKTESDYLDEKVIFEIKVSISSCYC